MISQLGFLSPEVDAREGELLAAYRNVFDVSERLSKLFVRLLREAELDRTSVRAMTMHALGARSLELFQSSIILLRKGCIPPARVLCRAMIETAYKLCAIQLASDGIDRYVSQENSTRLQKLRNIQKYKQAYPRSGVAAGIEAEIDVLSKEKPKKTEPHEWASLAKMDDFHNLYYQGMSDDTHANMESLNHYFDDEAPHIMGFGPSDKGLLVVATACHRTVINVVEKYAAFQGSHISDELSLLNKDNDGLESLYAR
ncbi:DUF5677 domain-containing protein [Cupriavidus sp. CuC1]|uniref:DUF5677 domain-containing protein n=1 Tax=Cupriavidus sp. CuC1 TaxID=3373131 RepID=UPI0037D85131